MYRPGIRRGDTEDPQLDSKSWIIYDTMMNYEKGGFERIHITPVAYDVTHVAPEGLFCELDPMTNQAPKL